MQHRLLYIHEHRSRDNACELREPLEAGQFAILNFCGGEFNMKDASTKRKWQGVETGRKRTAKAPKGVSVVHLCPAGFRADRDVLAEPEEVGFHKCARHALPTPKSDFPVASRRRFQGFYSGVDEVVDPPQQPNLIGHTRVARSKVPEFDALWSLPVIQVGVRSPTLQALRQHTDRRDAVCGTDAL